LTRPTYEHRLVGKILSADASGRASVDVRNRLVVGEAVEILGPGRPLGRDVIAEMTDDDGNQIDVAHAGMRVDVHLHTACGPNDLLRRRDLNVDAGDARQCQPKAPVRGPKP
jgi:putative protease